MSNKADFMANLMRAKQTMNKVENSNFKIDHDRINQTISGDVPLLESLPDGATPAANVTRPFGNASPDIINASRLPDAIKKIMIEQPIPKMTMASGEGVSFSLDDVKELVRPQIVQNSAPQNQITTGDINETRIMNSQGKMLITLTEAELDKKINDALLSFMATTFTKQLKEETIKRTISTLIKEGKIRVKQKTIK